MRSLAQRREVGIGFGAHWHRQAHGGQHGVLFRLFELALFFGDASSFCLLGLLVTLGVPGQVASLLPAADRRHDRVAQVVLAVRIIFDVGPLKVAAPAAWIVLVERKQVNT